MVDFALLEQLQDRHNALQATLRHFEFISNATKVANSGSQNKRIQFEELARIVANWHQTSHSSVLNDFASKLVTDAFDPLYTPLSKDLDSLLTKCGWPGSTIKLAPASKQEIMSAFIGLVDLFDILVKSGTDASQFQQPLHIVFNEVLVHFKYHFYLQKSGTNRTDKPEWMLRYALKLIEDHGSFLEFLQDGLNEREENSIIVKTEYISFLMGFLKEKIQQQAFRMMGNPELFSHLVTEAMRFDKTMLKVHQYDGYIDGQTYRGRVTDVFVEESQLFQCWLDIEREAAFYRYSEIMKVDPWNPSLSSAGLVKHTNSSEKLVDLLAVITERYRSLPPQYQVAFFEVAQLSILSQYLTDAKVVLNNHQSTFDPNTKEGAFKRKLDRLTKVLYVAGSLEVVTDATNEWSEDILFLDMLKFYNPSFNSDSDPLLNSVFAGIEKEYSKVIEQIESVVAEDCLQEIVESMWQYDSKKWNASYIEEGDAVSVELTEALSHTKAFISLISQVLPRKLCKGLQRALLAQIMDRLLTRPVSKYTFSLQGALQLERDVSAFISYFPPSIVRQTAAVKKMRDTLHILVLSQEQLLSLHERLSAGIMQS
ncbi:hypothetical protein BCR33DRAFT_763966 [Rhizoclosmatium globosum]|uniref:Uncharacterized protein n=1 Tax=Rhizoclosmatium globosum TaxID=329046 RepID=A0A1Y2CN48_9FUNG|nr:hypothetical protein BCR33DRAFT_763966 [Rhizoclosmatium globosum]|eukprot:ORY48254.1 hypothetical protein BCR33DRAFT_763966 [Rhizoclosmatium globosum]